MLLRTQRCPQCSTVYCGAIHDRDNEEMVTQAAPTGERHRNVPIVEETTTVRRLLQPGEVPPCFENLPHEEPQEVYLRY